MRTVLLLGFLTLPSVAPAQSPPADKISRCESLVALQSTAAQSKVRPYSLDLHGTNDAQLVYFGVRHTYDPADSQFVSMQSEWTKLNPTIAFYEGTNTRAGTSPDDAVRQDAEPGLLRFLAAKSGAPAHSLEPSREDEVNALVAKFTPEQLMMFYVTRPVAESVPESWFSPTPSSSPTTGKDLFNNINTASSFFRDVFMYRTLAAAASVPGARVFAEVGRDHVPAQAAGLKCVLGAD